MKKILFGFAISIALVFPATAQVNNGKVTTAAPVYANGAIAPFSLDLAGNQRVNCAIGCSGGSFDNNADAVATSAANGQSAAWLYGFNGTTWDRLRYTIAAGLDVNIKNASLPVTGTFWQATQPVSIASLPALPANQSVNVAQINGVTPLMGTGATGTGAQRVTVAVDSATVAGSASLPAGTNLIGKAGIDQTTPGTTNGVQDAATSATGAAVPSKAQLAGARSGANIVELIQASASVALTGNTATTTQLVALSGSTKIYVTSFDFLSVGTANVKFVYGTGSNCGTGTTDLTGNYNLTAQSGMAKGNGLGPVLVVPAGNALCWTNSAAIQVSGSVSYTQF